MLTFVIALLAYKKKQGDKTYKNSDSKLVILAWALWCFEELIHLQTIVGGFDGKFTFYGITMIRVILGKA